MDRPRYRGRTGLTGALQTRISPRPPEGASRKVWRSAKDAAVLAVKRVVRAADGTRKARFEKVK